MLIESTINGKDVVIEVEPVELSSGKLFFKWSNGNGGGFTVDPNSDKGLGQLEEMLAKDEELREQGKTVTTKSLREKYLTATE